MNIKGNTMNEPIVSQMWVVEYRPNVELDIWERFTVEPFLSKHEAELSKLRIIDEYGTGSRKNVPIDDKIRVAEYTREYIINDIMRDNDAIKRALSVLRTQTLLNVLYGEDLLPPKYDYTPGQDNPCGEIVLPEVYELKKQLAEEKSRSQAFLDELNFADSGG